MVEIDDKEEACHVFDAGQASSVVGAQGATSQRTGPDLLTFKHHTVGNILRFVLFLANTPEAICCIVDGLGLA